MSKHSSDDFADYVPVELRHRQDGWTPVRQVDFLVALSESACVDHPCRAVGMSPGSAYALRRRIEAKAFRAGVPRACARVEDQTLPTSAA
jgi:hypothetical protein